MLKGSEIAFRSMSGRAGSVPTGKGGGARPGVGALHPAGEGRTLGPSPKQEKKIAGQGQTTA